MITLKTLPQATLQEVFDQVALHMLRQGRPAIDKNGDCVYRGLDGLKCAAGCLIADDEYKPDMDIGPSDGSGTSWSCLTEGGFVPKLEQPMFDLIVNLQQAHDGADGMDVRDRRVVDYWIGQLGAVCEKHGLNYDVVEKFIAEGK